MIEPTILNTSDEAATLRTVQGWVSRHGRYFGADERTARYDGCTHVVCDCGAAVEKSRVRCDACQGKREAEEWGKLELVEWDGVTPLVLFRDDHYFFDVDELYDFASEHELKVSELRLCVCVPNVARQVSDDYWEGELPEDGELPAWLEKALDVLNKVIHEHRCEPLSWRGGRQRVVLPDEQETCEAEHD